MTRSAKLNIQIDPKSIRDMFRKKLKNFYVFRFWCARRNVQRPLIKLIFLLWHLALILNEFNDVVLFISLIVPAIGNFTEEVAYAGKPQDTNSIEYTLQSDEVQMSKKGDRNRNHPQSEY